MSDLHVTVVFEDGVVLAFSGELDRSVASIVTNVLDTIVGDDFFPRNLVLDLRDVRPIDADAGAALDQACRIARRRGYRYELRTAVPS